MNIRLINKIISVFRELSPRRPRNYHCSSFSKRVYNKNRVRRRSFAYLNTIRRVWCVCVCVCIRACISTFSRLHSAVKFYIDSSIVCSYIFCVHAIYYVYFAWYFRGLFTMDETWDVLKKIQITSFYRIEKCKLIFVRWFGQPPFSFNDDSVRASWLYIREINLFFLFFFSSLLCKVPIARK